MKTKKWLAASLAVAALGLMYGGTVAAANPSDTDPATVAQLKELENKVNEMKQSIEENAVHYFSVNSTKNDAGSNYKNDGAKQVDAIAIGAQAKSDGQSSIAMGYDSKVTGGWSIAIGQSANVSAQQLGTAIGYGATVTGNNGVALGTMAKATHNYALALGGQAQALQENTIAIGAGTKSSQFGGVSIGQESEVTQTAYKGIAIGAHAYVGPAGSGTTNPKDSKPKANLLFGEDVDDKTPSTAGMTEQNAMAVGMNAKAFGYQTTALGAGAEAHDTNTVAIGIGTIATGHYSTAVGKQAHTFADNATAIGRLAAAVGESASALGMRSYAYGKTSLALGAKSRAVDNNSIAIGANSLAKAAKDGKALYSDEDVKAAAGVVSVGNPQHEVIENLHNHDGSTVERKEQIAENYRRIVNMAGGIDNHDAVNVAQLKAVAEMPLHFYAGGKKEGNNYTVGATQWTMSPSDFHLDFGEGLKAEQIKKDGKTYTLVSIDKKSAVTDITVHAEKKNDADTNNKFTVTPDKPEMTVKGDGKNITATIEKDNTVKVALKDDINVKSVTAGKAKLSADGIAYDGKTYIGKDGLNANGKKVTHVAAGAVSKDSTDAVNGSQLFATNENVAANMKRIANLDESLGKVGAGAAALAALHPLDFDPDDKWDFTAGYGRYRGNDAVALGAHYRPNEDTMLSIAGTVGNGDEMFNAGISVKLGQGHHVSTSRVAMAKELKELRAVVEMQNRQIRQLTELVTGHAAPAAASHAATQFADVPADHWAVEYVRTLAARGLLEGYPDGEFKGDRRITRYELAAIFYRALQNGAPVDGRMSQAVAEFAPELEQVRLAERFRVDAVATDKDGHPTIERVRTVEAQ